MNRRDFLKRLTLASGSVFVSGCEFANLHKSRYYSSSAKKDKRPNVLFLFTDDQREDTIRALGNPHIQTPNLDKLVESGVVFHNAYCMGGYCPAVCLPSRIMTMRGRSWFHVRDLPEEAPSLPRSLNAAGYVTYHHGKLWNTAKRVHAHFTHTHYLEDQKVRESGHPGRIVADDAIEFLQGWKEKCCSDSGRPQPFFMYLAFATPHDPRVAIPEYMSKYDIDKIPLPENYLPLHPFDNGEMIIRDERLAAWPRTEKEIRTHLRDYYAVITYLDDQIGRLIRYLKEIGEYNNTIIVFSSDQGLAVGSHGLMGKQNLYEHSMGAPLIFVGPGIDRGQTSEAFAYLFDVYPTICDLLGLEIPNSLEGKSLAPVIHGKRKQVRDTIFLGYMDVQRAVRCGDWKLIRYPQINRSQLFNLKDDPYEMKDLAGDPVYATKLKELTKRMHLQQKVFGDTCLLTSQTPKPSEVTAQKLKDRAQRWDAQHNKRK